MSNVRKAPACGPSSRELKANVANFLERAEQIESHPLAGRDSTFKVQFTLHPTNGEVMATGFDMQARPDEDWLTMAVRMRPIIFLETDSVSIPRLTSQIEREHQLLRGQLKQARSRLAAWKKHAFVYAGNLDRAGPRLQPDEFREQHVKIGPPGVSPSGVSLDGLSTDYNYADTYLNANLWHADAAKAIEYQSASDHMKLHYRKCAEIRVLSAAKDIIPPLKQWILDARSDGHDL